MSKFNYDLVCEILKSIAHSGYNSPKHDQILKELAKFAEKEERDIKDKFLDYKKEADEESGPSQIFRA